MAAKKPQDHKPKTEAHAPDEMFVYTSRDGKTTLHLPYLENLTRRQVKALQAAETTGEDADDVLFKMLLDEDEYAALDDLTLLDQKNLMEQWNAESAIQLGES